MKLTCVIIDDEQYAIKELTDLIAQMPNLSLYKTFTNPIIALTEIGVEDCIDIIFLDVDMPQMSGIELAKEMRDKARFIILTTAHSKYAVEGFDVRADHFLLKPISLSKFAIALTKLIKEDQTIPEPPKQLDDHFFIKADMKKRIKINFSDLIAIEGATNYVKIYTTQATYSTHVTMKEMELSLHERPEFIRVHKSFIVSKLHIEIIDGNTIKTKYNMTIPIGSLYKTQLMQEFSKKTINSGG